MKYTLAFAGLQSLHALITGPTLPVTAAPAPRVVNAEAMPGMALPTMHPTATWQATTLVSSRRPGVQMVLFEPQPLQQMKRMQTVELTPQFTTPPEPVSPAPSAPVPNRYSTSEWIDSLRSLPRSVVWRRISSRVQFQAGLASLVVLARYLGFTPSMPALIHSLLGGFLGLLLVFRTNAAYARFWEGRCLWGLVNNNCRNVAIALVANVRPIAPAAAKQLAKALLEYPSALLAICDEKPQANQEVAQVCLRMHKALASASQHGRGALSMYEQLQLSRAADLVNKLIDNALGCARIVNTPVPKSYSRHTSRFLTMWCGTLPFVLAPMIGPVAIPTAAVISWSLFGIEELGHLIEQPFEVNADAKVYDVGIPANQIARNIEAGIQDVLDY